MHAQAEVIDLTDDVPGQQQPHLIPQTQNRPHYAITPKASHPHATAPIDPRYHGAPFYYINAQNQPIHDYHPDQAYLFQAGQYMTPQAVHGNTPSPTQPHIPQSQPQELSHFGPSQPQSVPSQSYLHSSRGGAFPPNPAWNQPQPQHEMGTGYSQALSGYHHSPRPMPYAFEMQQQPGLVYEASPQPTCGNPQSSPASNRSQFAPVGMPHEHTLQPILPNATSRKRSAADGLEPPTKSKKLASDGPPLRTVHTTAEPMPIPTAQTEPQLCKEQLDLIDLIVRGHNVFYTGSAGCGKSTVLRAFVSRLKHMNKRVKILAPTGKAALDINGSTTWSFAGWTPNHMKRPIEELEKAAFGRFVRKRMLELDVLVIDEISMVENLHLERLSRVMKKARGSELPFGGVQVVITGDFCQLPPVKPFQFCMDCGRELIPLKAEGAYKCHKHGRFLDADKWAFCSKAWKEANLKHVHLTQIHRQSDQVFVKILQKFRLGTPISSEDRALLLNHPCDTKNATRLFSTLAEVKRVNDAAFARLQSSQLDFRCLDDFSWNPQHRHLERMRQRGPDGSLLALREHRLDALAELKKGMLVVLLVNLDVDSGLVNGSQGEIVGFESYSKEKLPKRSMKAAGKRGKEEEIPAERQTIGGDYAELREAQIAAFIDQAEVKCWPIVCFDNGITRTIYAECRVNEVGDDKPYSLLMRTQIPLVAAWAMTIHKSQGMTLNKVIVDLAKSFESGQEYVALSRARSLEGLKVESLGQTQSSGDQDVRKFLADEFGIS